MKVKHKAQPNKLLSSLQYGDCFKFKEGDCEMFYMKVDTNGLAGGRGEHPSYLCLQNGKLYSTSTESIIPIEVEAVEH